MEMASWYIGLKAPFLLFYYAITTIFFLSLIPPANSVSFNYSGFRYTDQVKLEGDATISHSNIQVTINAIGQRNNYSIGRVSSFKQMHLWDKSSNGLTDFFTKFSFIIYSEEEYFGDGLTFFLADPDLPVLKNMVEGGGLGLVDGDQAFRVFHPFVAVEFDTYSNSWDPTGRHVGININSMMSKITELWADAIPERKPYDCSIDYNSSTQNLSVSFTGYVRGEQIKQNISLIVDLRQYLPEWVMFGFSAATGDLFETHTLQSWSFSSTLESDERWKSDTPTMAASPGPSPNNPANKNNSTVIWIWIGIGLSLAVSILVLGCFVMLNKTREREESEFDLNMDDEFQKDTGPKKFCYKELVNATSNFAEAQKLGQGGFGSVYKGNLKELNCYVAIKRISRDSKQGIKEYATEVKIISQLRHRNLVQLVGWCHKKNDLLLIYEFMPNGSLDSYLYQGKSFLTWPLRYNIALGLASALLYLQEECKQCVLHRDIKSSNIMLDSSFNAKLGDFGLARLVDHEKGSQTTLIVGTRGYMAPEYITTGRANKESDLYSFGVVLLEIASGRKPVDLKAKEDQITIVEWAWKLYGLGKLLEAADSKLCGVFDVQQMECLIVIGLWCTHPDCSSRPSIRKVNQVLNFEASLPVLPKKFPVPTYLPPTIESLFRSVSFSWNSNCDTM